MTATWRDCAKAGRSPQSIIRADGRFCPHFLGDDPTQRPSTRDIASHDQVRMQPRCFYWQTANLFDPFAAAARSPATKSSLSSACCATAAAIFQKILHILPPIVEGDFFFRLDSAQCYDHDPALASHWFCIRPAGMIDVTRRVPSRRAVDGPSLVDLELVSGAACLTPIGFFGGNAPAAIRRDIDPSLDWLCREQTEPSDGTTNPKGARGHQSRIAANFHNVTSNRRNVTSMGRRLGGKRSDIVFGRAHRRVLVLGPGGAPGIAPPLVELAIIGPETAGIATQLQAEKTGFVSGNSKENNRGRLG